MPEDDAIKFECCHCAQPLEAPVEMRGMVIECPGCGKKVTVKKTHSEAEIAALNERLTRNAPKNSIPAQKVVGNPYIEETLEVIGKVFFFVGFIGAFISGICFLASLANDQETVQERIGLFGLAVVCIAQGFIAQALFSALAEIIRLLRKLVEKS